MRRTVGEFIRPQESEDILEEIKVDPVEKELAQYKQKWLNHISRMEDIRHPKQLLDYQSIGRQSTRRIYS
jgi:hypothetical protein